MRKSSIGTRTRYLVCFSSLNKNLFLFLHLHSVLQFYDFGLLSSKTQKKIIGHVVLPSIDPDLNFVVKEICSKVIS